MGKRKILEGKVISDEMDKTIIVEVEKSSSHPLYKKKLIKIKKYKVHDKDNKAKIGNKVRIIESRPLSKEKRFALLEILETTHPNTDKDVDKRIIKQKKNVIS